MMKYLVLLMGLCLSTIAVSYPESNLDCKNPRSNAEIKQCLHKDLEDARKEMNATLEKLLSSARKFDEDNRSENGGSPADAERKLNASQKLWQEGSELNCEVEALGFWGGTGYPIAKTECLVRETKSRIQFFKNLQF